MQDIDDNQVAPGEVAEEEKEEKSKEKSPDDLVKMIDYYNTTFKDFSSDGLLYEKAYYSPHKTEIKSLDCNKNIFWSNTNLMMAAIFSKRPRIRIKRFVDKDNPFELALAQFLSQAVEHVMDEGGLEGIVKQSLQDYSIVGRGNVWNKYYSEFDEIENPQTKEKVEVIKQEGVEYEYVGWRDFGHNVAMTWAGVHTVWRVVHFSKITATEFFGKDVIKDLAFDSTEENNEVENPASHIKPLNPKDGTRPFYEIWCTETGMVYFLDKQTKSILRKKKISFKFQGKFPCPKPLYATLNTSSLIPKGDLFFYEDELQNYYKVRNKIYDLVDMIKVVGVCSGASAAIKDLFTSANGTMIPIDNISALFEKGGVRSLFDMLDISPFVSAITELRTELTALKAEIDEISGVADIMRGQLQPEMTATGEEIRDKWGNLRLSTKQDDVQEYLKNIAIITAELIIDMPNLEETFKDIVFIDNVVADDAQLAPEQMEGKIRWSNFIAQVRQVKNIHQIINIETDSTIKTNEDKKKAAKMELANVITPMIEKAKAIVGDPDLVKLYVSIIKFILSSFEEADELENEIDDFLAILTEKSKAPLPDPNAQAMQIEQMRNQNLQALQSQEQQFELQKTQLIENNKQALENMKNVHQKEIEMIKAQSKMEIEALRAEVRLNDTGKATYGQPT